VGTRAAVMVLIPDGTFRMSTHKRHPEEAPVRRVTVDGFTCRVAHDNDRDTVRAGAITDARQRQAGVDRVEVPYLVPSSLPRLRGNSGLLRLARGVRPGTASTGAPRYPGNAVCIFASNKPLTFAKLELSAIDSAVADRCSTSMRVLTSSGAASSARRPIPSATSGGGADVSVTRIKAVVRRAGPSPTQIRNIVRNRAGMG
jgi:hypothetical protein